jgi:hypothetical protein
VKVAFGLKAHSGWAALVVVGAREGEREVVDRRRIELVDEGDAQWGRQPYHAAEDLAPEAGRAVVERGVAAAQAIALRQMRAAVERAHRAGHEVAACAVLVANPMPDWSVGEILAVHFRMHKAEGVLFRDVLVSAAGTCGLRAVRIPESSLPEQAGTALGLSTSRLAKTLARLGKSVGAPWGKDQKDAALAALIALG